MAADKFDYEDTFWFGAIKAKTIFNATENGFINNNHHRIDYNEEYESYGYVDYKDHFTRNQNQSNFVIKYDGEKPDHTHVNYDDPWFS